MFCYLSDDYGDYSDPYDICLDMKEYEEYDDCMCSGSYRCKDCRIFDENENVREKEYARQQEVETDMYNDCTCSGNYFCYMCLIECNNTLISELMNESEYRFRHYELHHELIDKVKKRQQNSASVKKLRKHLQNRVLRELRDNHFNANGFNCYGYNKDGYDKDGFDRLGYGSNGYNKDGFDRLGYGSNGYNKYGYDKDGYDKDGFDKYNRDRGGYHKSMCVTDYYGSRSPFGYRF